MSAKRDSIMDSVIETIMNRRSVRVFDGRNVPEGDLATILEAANNAPSAHNRQPWRFIVLQGGKKDELAALVGGSSADYPKSAGALMRMAGRSIFTAPIAVAVVATAEKDGEAAHVIDEVMSADVARM